MIYMVGAPPHQDMYDLKMEAPAEIRGEFKAINTKGDIGAGSAGGTTTITPPSVRSAAETSRHDFRTP